jgi:hypothetical protein
MIEIAEFEFDDRNRRHLREKGRIDENTITEVWSGDPVFAINPPAENRSGTTLMIGPDVSGRLWTIVIVCVDEASGVWRPITGWPATGKEGRAWQSAH